MPGCMTPCWSGCPPRTGLLVAPGNPKQLNSLTDVLSSRAKTAVRQPGAGAQMLLETLLARPVPAKICAGSSRHADGPISPPRSAPARRFGVATRAAAKARDSISSRCCREFDLLTRQRSYFQPPMQALIGFLRDKRLKQRATELSGYDPAPAVSSGSPLDRIAALTQTAN